MAIVLPHHTLQEIPTLLFAELSKSTVHKKHPFRNVVLSTVNKELPKSRWVVFRKLTSEKTFYIYTDARSEKVTELTINSNCGLLFYHQRHGLQIRFEGVAQIHQQNALTHTFWPGVMGNSAKNYTTTLPPGTPIESVESGNSFLKETTDTHFVIIEIIPQRMEMLQLGRDGHIRASFKRVNEEWQGTFLVP